MSDNHVPYTDDGIPLLTKTLAELWDAIPEETKEAMHARALAMTADQWDDFSQTVVLDGPPTEDLLANAIPDEND